MTPCVPSITYVEDCTWHITDLCHTETLAIYSESGLLVVPADSNKDDEYHKSGRWSSLWVDGNKMIKGWALFLSPPRHLPCSSFFISVILAVAAPFLSFHSYQSDYSFYYGPVSGVSATPLQPSKSMFSDFNLKLVYKFWASKMRTRRVTVDITVWVRVRDRVTSMAASGPNTLFSLCVLRVS